MIEEGVITKTDGDFATVKIDKNEQCSKCGMCLFPENVNYIELSVKNTINAKPDDKVLIEKNENGKLLSLFLIFFVPLLLIGLSTVLGLFVIKNELSILLLSVFLIVMWFFVLSFIDKKLSKKINYTAKIIKKI
ncbi:MAG: SoxR reducing system RseC family protein [Clostridia bacterium]|nr:SoxR reducing system RseC family protein [Clostridia bacterium]